MGEGGQLDSMVGLREGWDGGAVVDFGDDGEASGGGKNDGGSGEDGGDFGVFISKGEGRVGSKGSR